MTEPTVGAWVWASGSQVWNGNIGTLTPKPTNMPAKIHSWLAAGDVRRGTAGQGSHVEGVGLLADQAPVGQEVQRQEAHQHQGRTEHRVEEELQRCIPAIVTAPDGDHEEHRQQHDLEEHEEQDQVLRQEGADHAGFEDEYQRQEGLGVVWLGEVVPAVDDAQRHDEQRQRHQRQRHAVDGEDEPGVDDLDPLLVGDELQLTGVVVIELEHDRGTESRGSQGGGQRRPL